LHALLSRGLDPNIGQQTDAAAQRDCEEDSFDFQDLIPFLFAAT
jgi:hypothetical protein